MGPFASSRGTKIVVALALGLALGLPAPATSYAAESSEASEPGWVQMRDEDGIRVSRKEIPGSGFLALRGEGDVDKPLLLVGSVLVDVARSREWVDSVVDARVLRAVDATEYVTYTHVGTPVTMADRDFVTDVKLEVDPATKRLFVRMHSVADPLAPKTRYVRGDVVESRLVLTPIDGGRRTHVVAEIHADPKGGVAAWLVNFFQKDWGYNTLKRLRSQSAKPDIRVDSGLKGLLEARGYFGDAGAAGVTASAARD
jgi:hypothetical protein